MVELTLLTVVVVDLIKEFCIKVCPFLKGVFLSKKTWRHVLRYKGCLYENRTRTAHRVNEVSLASPTGHEYHTCCKHFVQWSFNAFLTITTAVERLSRGVKGERAVVLRDMDIQTEVWIGNRDIRALTASLKELVNNGILHLIGHKP